MAVASVWGEGLQITGDGSAMQAAGGKASGAIRVTNKGEKEIDVKLRAGSGVNPMAGSSATPAIVTFAETQAGKGATEFVYAKLAGGASIDLWVEINGVAAPGITQIPLLQDGEKFGSLQVERLDFPFAVKIDPATTELLIEGGVKGGIRLVNEDAVAYRVKWQFELPSQTYQGSDVIVPAKGQAKIAIDTVKESPFAKWGWMLGLLKDDIQEGLLTLALQPMEKADPPPVAPSRTTRVPVRLRFYPNMAGVLNNTFLIIDLFLGACASMLLKLWLPNSRRKLKLKEDLEMLGRQIADVSGRVGARPTVMLRVQQKRLLDLLNPKMTGGRMAVSPDFEDVAKHAEVAATRLKKQLELIRSVDHSAARLACLTGKPLPPSALARIETCMDRIVSLATPIEADEDDLQSVQTDLTQVAVCVDQMEQSNTGIRQFMQERLTELVGFFQPLLPPAAQNGTTSGESNGAPAAGKPMAFSPSLTAHGGAATALALAPEEEEEDEAAGEPLSAAARRFQHDLPETFHALRNPTIPENITFEALAELDSHLFKLSLIRRYLQLAPDLSEVGAAPDSPARVYKRLIDVLRLRSWDAIRTAQVLIGQAEQGLYREDVEDAIRDGHVYIWCDRQVIRPNTPVEFALKFGRSTLNHASARDEFRCEWTFEHPAPPPGGWMRRTMAWVLRAPAKPLEPRTMTVPGHCWTIYQYFPQAGPHTVKVKLENWHGESVVGPNDKPTEPVTMSFTVEKRGWDKAGPRLRLEIVSMALALAPALFALLTAAQEQVAKVSWSTALGAVFALGFGVDTLKNLLTTRQP